MRHPRPGFTAIELIIVIAILVIIMAGTLPFLATFQQRSTLGTIAEDVMQTLKRAQHRSLTGERDRAWGVRMLSGAYVLYAGNSYALRETSFDEVHTATQITFSGLREVTFRKIYGTTMTGGTIVLTFPGGGAKSITVNNAGRASFQ